MSRISMYVLSSIKSCFENSTFIQFLCEIFRETCELMLASLHVCYYVVLFKC